MQFTATQLLNLKRALKIAACSFEDDARKMRRHAQRYIDNEPQRAHTCEQVARTFDRQRSDTLALLQQLENE